MRRYLTAILLIAITMAGCSMIDLSANPNFQAQLDDGGKPATIVHVQEDIVEAEKTLEVDWGNNTAESNVDYTSSPPNAGDVIIDRPFSWTAESPSGTPPSIRAGHTATEYEGKMYVFGGGTFKNDLHEYDIAGDSWSQKTPTGGPPSARNKHSSVECNGKIYIYGGNISGGVTNTLWEYDISGDTWTQLTSGATARSGHSAVVNGAKMYIFGGQLSGGSATNTLWEYDILGDTWTQLTSGATARFYHTAIGYNGNMYVYGGASPTYLANVYEYNINLDSWTAKSTSGPTRGSHTAVPYDNSFFVFGGLDGTLVYNQVWEYNMASDLWTQRTAGSTIRESHSAIEFNGLMYVFGGFDFNGPTTYNDLYSNKIGYYLIGNITTDNIDIGEVPTVTGEWQIQDTKPDGTGITYEAWSSATGAFIGEESYLGTMDDGDPITDLKEFYRVKSSFTTNTARDKTPTLHSIKADFSTYKTFTDSQRIGQENDYEMGLMPISGISSEINDFKESTIGQITPVLDFNESISKYLYGKYPKNKIVKVLIGFDDPAFPVSDFLEFFRGQVVDYNITSDDKVSLITQAFQVEWNKKVPETWENVGDDVTWTNMHPIDVMLDIIRNYMTVRDSKIVASSFAEVKALIPSFTVTRTITKNPVEAKKLMEELRLLTGSYFLPRSDGKIKIIRFDPTEAVVATLTDANTKDMGGYKGNLKTLINKTLVYFAHDGEGDDAADYAALAIDVTTGADSHDNWGEWKTKEVKDKWTLEEDIAQVVSMSDVQLARYKNPPAIIQRVGDKKLLYIEAGDMVAVTTKRAPSADGVSGIVDKKFQVIKPSLDFKGDKVTLTLLEV